MKRLLKQTLGIMICLTLVIGTVSTVFAVGDFEECCYCGETVLVDDLCDCGGCGDTTTACWAENHCEECGLCLEGEEYCLDCAPEIELPIEFDGSSLAGIKEPKGIEGGVSDGESYYHCDGSCGLENSWISNIWVDNNYEPVTEFVDGEKYIFQIMIHPEHGYKLPVNLGEEVGIKVTGVEWEGTYHDCYDAGNLYYAEFYITYNAEIGIPAEKVVDLPIVIDGSELAGITEPTGITSLPTGDTFEYCDGACADERFAANAWFDADDYPVDEFVAGYDYYYQISIHPTEGYHFPADISELEDIEVTGVEWETVNYYYDSAKDLYYANFWIHYDGNGIPALKEVEFPIVIDGSELVGITEPTGIANLPESEEYYFCDDSCGGGWYVSNKWFDTSDNEVTEFVDGEKYYFQISIHPQNGYLIPEDFDYDTGIKVEGVNWDYVRGHIMQKDSVIYYYMENYITYNAETGIPGTEELFVKGDINKDGKISIIDVVMARAHIVKTKTLTEEQIKLGDMNSDGKISIIDVVMMRSKIVNG